MHWMCSITSCSTLLHHSFILTITLHSLNTAIINICIHCIAPIAGNIFWIHTVHAVCLWNNVVNDWLSYSTWSYSNMASWGEDLDCVIVHLDTTLSSSADEVVQLFIIFWFRLPGHTAMLCSTTVATTTSSVLSILSRMPYFKHGNLLFSAQGCMSCVVAAFCFWCFIQNWSEHVRPACIAAFADQVAFNFACFKHCCHMTIVKHCTVVDRTWPACDHVQDLVLAVANQLYVDWEWVSE